MSVAFLDRVPSQIRRIANGTPPASAHVGMKKVLRNTDTSMFIKSDGGETEVLDLARSFGSYDEAVNFCNDRKIKTVELVVRMEDKSEMVMSVPSHRLEA